MAKREVFSTGASTNTSLYSRKRGRESVCTNDVFSVWRRQGGGRRGKGADSGGVCVHYESTAQKTERGRRGFLLLLPWPFFWRIETGTSEFGAHREIKNISFCLFYEQYTEIILHFLC